MLLKKLLAESPEQGITQLPGYTEVSDKNLFDFNEFDHQAKTIVTILPLQKVVTRRNKSANQEKKLFLQYHFLSMLRDSSRPENPRFTLDKL